MTLQTVCEKVASICRTVGGVRSAPAIPQDGSAVFPLVVVFPGRGVLQTQSGGFMTALHDVVAQVHVARKDLAADMTALYPLMDKIPQAILSDVTLGGTCQTFDRIDYEMMQMSWAGIETIGVQMTLVGVKLQPTI